MPNIPHLDSGAEGAADAKREIAQPDVVASQRTATSDDREHIGAFGCTFVLAPSFSLKLGTDWEAIAIYGILRTEGLGMLIMSELQAHARAGLNFWTDMAPLLGASAHRVLSAENAGGASHISEAMSAEVLERAFGAAVARTELELRYWPSGGPITDFSVALGDECVQLGVSVTRALHAETAEALLRKKLGGVIESTRTCCNGGFRKQVLHVWTRTRKLARALRQAYAAIDAALVADTVVLVTVCSGLSELFTEKQRAPRPRAPRAPKGQKDEQHLRVLQESDPVVAALRDNKR